MPGPVPGDQIPPLAIPQGRLCFWTAFVQTSVDQYLQLTDSNGAEILAISGASIPVGGGNPTPLGSGFFTASDPKETYTLRIGTNSGAGWNQVMWEYIFLDQGSGKLVEQYIFASEDGGDADFNDSFLLLWWFRSVG